MYTQNSFKLEHLGAGKPPSFMGTGNTCEHTGIHSFREMKANMLKMKAQWEKENPGGPPKEE